MHHHTPCPTVRTRALAALALGALALSAAPAFAAGSAAAGKTIFLKDCAVCHKADASGGIKLGDAKSADLRAPELETVYHENDASLAAAILNGKDEDGEDLDKIMPRWKGKLTDTQVADIIAFLKTEMK